MAVGSMKSQVFVSVLSSFYRRFLAFSKRSDKEVGKLATTETDGLR